MNDFVAIGSSKAADNFYWEAESPSTPWVLIQPTPIAFDLANDNVSVGGRDRRILFLGVLAFLIFCLLAALEMIAGRIVFFLPLIVIALLSLVIAGHYGSRSC